MIHQDVKIKCNLTQLNSFVEYLKEILTNYDQYLNCNFNNKFQYEVMRHEITTLSEKTMKLFISKAFRGHKDKKFTLSITHTQRISLFNITALYPLPLDINFIEYEIKNGLLK